MTQLEQMKALKEERAKVREAMKAMVDRTYEATKGQVGDQPVMMSQQFTAEETEQHNALIKEWETIEATMKVVEEDKDRDRIAAEKADLIAGNNTAQNRQAKVNAEYWKNLVAVGHGGKYENTGKIAEQGHPGELLLPAPAIIKGEDGVNRVHPFPAVYDEKDEGVDLEATFRHAEMIKAGVTNRYDPRTGKRLEAAGDDPIITTDVPAAIPDLSVDLYRYMITRNEVGMYCRVYQTSGLNDLPIQRRTGVPKATIVGTNVNYGQNVEIDDQQSTFDSFTLKAFKYAFISQYSYESMMTIQPWSVSAQVAEDGGIGLANGFGEHVVIGTGSGEPRGIQTAAKADTNQVVSGVSAANAFTGTNLFKWGSFVGFITALPIPYFKAAGKYLITGLPAWGNLLSVTDTNGQQIFNPEMNVNQLSLPKFGLNVILDQNIDQNIAANSYPFIIGDLDGHAVRYAGGARVDFTDQLDWKKDLLSYKFVQYADCDQLDIHAFRGYKFVA